MDSDGGSPVDPDGTGDRFTQGAPEFAAGTVVGHYTIQERIGAGGMGQVYLARDTLLNRSVALKFMSSRDQGDPALKRRFMREARAAASISHPNIVTIFEVSEHDGRPFIAMERVEGRSVDELVAGTPVPIDTVVDIGMQLCEGLKEAHQSGVIHRDIKPANILVDQSGRVRLVDFGLARSEGESRVTQTGETVGTLNYMSPEQLSGKPVDSRSDLFSLGVVLYEMLTGKCPFSGRYGAETLYAIVNLQPERPSALRADVPQRLDDLVMTLLEKEPDARYRSADDVGIDLQSILDEHTGSAVVPPQRVPAIRRLSRLRLVAWTGVALMAVAVIVAVLSGFPRELRIFDSPTDTEALAVMGFQNMEDPEDTARVGQILQELIITDLADVSSIQVIGSQRLFDEQKKLGHTERRGIDQAVATEVARRAGADIMLTGNLMRLGDHWILNCHLVNVGDGTVIISRRIDGEDLYAMVDQLSGQVRTGLSLTSDVPERERVSVREKTSTSLAAYRHYLAGVDFLNVGSLEPAMAEFEQAIEEDPDFHQAFYKLAFAQWWSRDTESRQGSESIERILSEQRYTTDRERRLAEGAQAMLNYRFTDAVAIYEDLSADYPDDKEIWFVLGLAYSNESSLNRVRALAAFEKCIELDLTYVLAYREIYDLHMDRRDYPRAWEMANDLVTIQPDGLMGYRFLVEAAMARGDSSQIRLALDLALTHHKTPEDPRSTRAWRWPTIPTPRTGTSWPSWGMRCSTRARRRNPGVRGERATN